jgi:6-phosphogluconolactonase (cycloisomerase 2 family)
MNYVQGVKTLSDGSFSSKTQALEINGSTNSDFIISPDGRWAVIIGMGDPELTILKIERNGEMSVVQQIDFDPITEAMAPIDAHYTPNGKYLIVTFFHLPSYILSFSVNQQTGIVTQVDRFGKTSNPIFGHPRNSAITPDGKFLLVSNINVPNKIFFDPFLIGEDGKLTWLKDKRCYITRFSSKMVFVPPWRETLAPPHGWLAH